MSNPRIVQHKPKREEAKVAQLTSLKRENHSLKRAIKRLEKEIGKRIEVEEDVAEQGLEEAFVPTENKTVQENHCGACGSVSVRSLTLIDRVYRVCVDCKARNRVI